MIEKKDNQIIEKLNQLGRKLGALKQTGNEDDRLKLNAEIFENIVNLFPKPKDDQCIDDAIAEFFLSDFKDFDPTLGELGAFSKVRINLRIKDIKRKAISGQHKIVEDPVTGDKQRKFVPLDSLDALVNNENAATKLDTIAANADSDPYAMSAFDETAYQLILLMMELPQRLEGRANNPTRQNYFRLFFTDGIATALHSEEIPPMFHKRERDLFQTLKTSFLDYFMLHICRTVDEIAASPVKPYEKVVEGRGPEETPLPLPNDVYTAYLNQKEGYVAKAPAVTQQKQAYRQFIRENLDR